MKITKLLILLLSSLLVLNACSSASQTTDSQKSKMTPGSYAIETAGFGGTYSVVVEVDEDSILSVTPGDNSETFGIGTKALEIVSESIVEHQSYNVDGLSGATVSSTTLKSAVKKALEQAGADMEKFGAEYTEKVESPVDLADFKQDVIVVGGGWAGMMAALEAADAGAKVLLIEKTHHLGGAGTYSGARIGGADTKIQQAANIEDSAESYYGFMKDLAEPLGTFNSELAMTYAKESGITLDRMADLWNFEFDPTPSYTYFPENVDRTHVGIDMGMGFTIHFNDLIDEKVKAGNIYVLRNTAAESLIKEEGRIIGVASKDASYYADAVILATGGYAHNSELLDLGFTHVGSSAVPTSDGSGFIMAQEAGAKLVNMEYSKNDPGMLDTGDFEMTYSANVNYPGMIWLDVNGKRPIDDEASLNQEEKSMFWYETENNTVYLLLPESKFDKENPVLYKTAYALPDLNNEEFNRQLESKKAIVKAEALEDVADFMNADVSEIKASVMNLEGFEEGPYYVFKTIPSVLCSYGGVQINSDAEVLDVNGEVIPGLYAAGEMIGAANFVGASPFNGGFLAMAVTFGRIAGENAGAAALNEK